MTIFRLNVLLLVLGDALIYTGALAAAVFVRRPGIFSTDYFGDNIGIFLPLFALWLFFNAVIGMYDFRQIRTLTDLVGDTVLSFFYGLVASFAVLYMFPPEAGTPKTNLLVTIVISYLLCFYWRRLWLDLISSDGFARKVYFLGRPERFELMKLDMKNRQYSEYQCVPEEKLAHLVTNLKTPRQHEKQSVKLRKCVDIVVADTEALPDPLGNSIVKAAAESEIPVWDYFDFYEKFYQKIPISEASRGEWILTHMLKREKYFYPRIKRLSDFTAASGMFIALSPLFAIIALAIKISDGGTVFYKQERVGYLGKPFLLWKFRTMVPGADKQMRISTGQEDDRITPVGRLLRQYRLDELPQIFNIIRGEMSFVGPRPLWTGETQAFEINGFQLRHMVKPGLSGWAQIYSSAANTTLDIMEKLRYDLYYVKNISPAIDLAILLKTAKRIFQSEKAMRERNIHSYAAHGAKR